MNKSTSEFIAGITVEKIVTNDAVRERFKEIYREVFSTDAGCTGCSEVVSLALSKLKTHFKKMAEKKTSVSFVKPSRIYCATKGIVVTPTNLTDELAKALIAESPKNAEMFNGVPESWLKQKTEKNADKGGDPDTVKKGRGKSEKAASDATSKGAEENTSDKKENASDASGDSPDAKGDDQK